MKVSGHSQRRKPHAAGYAEPADAVSAGHDYINKLIK